MNYQEMLQLTKSMPKVNMHASAVVQDKQLNRQNKWLQDKGLTFDDIRNAYRTAFGI